MAAERTLVRLARDSEDVAGGLRVFRDALPRDVTRITSIIGKLFGISSLLTSLDAACVHPRYEPSFYRVKDEIHLVIRSLTATLEVAFDMFGRTKDVSHEMVWADNRHRMEQVEGVGLYERLTWYEILLKSCAAILQERRSVNQEPIREQIVELFKIQAPLLAASRAGAAPPYPSRPPAQRFPPFRHTAMPTSPTDSSGGWDNPRPPYPTAPEPPISPTYTTSSSHTMNSSHTSYSSGGFSPLATGVHWCRDIFDGKYPATAFYEGHQLPDRSMCHGSAKPEALHRLREDGFQRALEIPFDNESVWIRFYCRPTDSRVRILYLTNKSMHSVPLTQLVATREKSMLKLCRARERGGYSLWAVLNFAHYERMVLFYCTFVALKHQDSKETIPEPLLESFELREELLFSGQICHGDMLHALRLLRDQFSGVIRIDVSPLRGPKADVPIWTAFITRYIGDMDWLALEDGGLVTLAALKPPPYVFLAGYRPPKRDHDYALQFTSTKDATFFVQAWNGVCNSRR